MEKDLFWLTVSGNTIHHGRVGHATVVVSFVALKTIDGHHFLVDLLAEKTGSRSRLYSSRTTSSGLYLPAWPYFPKFPQPP